MRWIRILSALLNAKLKKKLTGTETVTKSFRVWITDIDLTIMNHAAIIAVLETGRLDLMVRSNFLKIANKNGWLGLTQAISVQFYKPLKVFQKAEIFTRISYVDEKWIYLEQKIERKGKVIATCLVKNTVKKGRKTIYTPEVMKALNIDDFPTFKYDLMKTYELENTQMNEKLIANWDDQ